jgi:hypothetical protein
MRMGIYLRIQNSSACLDSRRHLPPAYFGRGGEVYSQYPDLRILIRSSRWGDVPGAPILSGIRDGLNQMCYAGLEWLSDLLIEI